MNPRWLILIPFALAGFALGYIDTPEPGSAPSAMKAPSSALRTAAAPSSPEDGRQQLGEKLRVSLAHASGLHRLHDLSALFGELPVGDLEMVAKLIDELPREFREEVRRALALRLLVLDPQAAAKFVESAPDFSLVQTFAREWSKTEPDTALRWLAALPGDAPRKGMQMDSSFAPFAKRDPRRAAELALSDPEHFGKDSCRAAFEEWGKVDAAAAIARASALTNTHLRRAALKAAAQGWASFAPEAALAWFRQIDDPRLRGEIADGLVRGLVEKDSGSAIEIVRTMPEGRIRDTALVSIAEHFRLHGKRDEALQLLATIPFDRETGGLASVYFGLFQEDVPAALGTLFQRMNLPSADADERRGIEIFLSEEGRVFMAQESEKFARALADTTLGADDLRTRLVEDAASQWAGKNAAAAREWIGALPAGPLRERAFAGAASGWAWSSQKEAADWLATLPPSGDRDAAIAGYARSTLRRDPGGTLDWLGKIPSPVQRQTALEAAWKNWRRADRTSAESWRETAPGLSTGDRARLR